MVKEHIFVTGGTGLLGSYILRLLVRSGYKVTAICRASSSKVLVRDVENQVNWVNGDILDVPFLYDTIAKVDKVIHAAAFISFSKKDRAKMMEINATGTANVINACLENNTQKLIHISSISAIGRSKNKQHIDEKSKWEGGKINSDYGISKYLSEQEVWRGIAEGLNAAILNPSVILGGGFWESGSCQLFQKVWNGLKFYPLGTTGYVDVRDVAKAALLLLESNICSERFILSGENLSYQNLFNQIASGFKKPVPKYKVTPFIQESAWIGAKLLSLFTGKTPLLTKETARHSSKSYFYNGEKIEQAIKLEYTPINQTIQEVCKIYLESQNEKRDYGILSI